MPLVTDSQLAALRTVGYRGLDSEVLIERPTQVQTDFGSKEQFNTIATVPGWIREMSTTRAGEMLNVIATTGTFRLHVPFDTDIRPADRVTVNGTQFTVGDTNSDNTIRVFTTAICRRVE